MSEDVLPAQRPEYEGTEVYGDGRDHIDVVGALKRVPRIGEIDAEEKQDQEHRAYQHSQPQPF